MLDYPSGALAPHGSQDLFRKLRDKRAEISEKKAAKTHPVVGDIGWVYAVDRQRFLLMLAVAAVAIVSIGLSKYGLDFALMRDGGDTLQTRLASIAVSIAAGFGQIVGWHILLDTKHYAGFWRKLGGFIAAVLFLIFGWATSSTFNVAALTAPSAINLYRGEQLDERIAVFEAARSQAETVSLLKPMLEGEAQAWCGAAAAEAATGAFSGSAGAGPLTGALKGQCARSEAVVAAVVAAEAVLTNVRGRAEGVLSELEGLLADVSRPVLERERDFATKLREVDAIIRELDRVQIAEVAQAYFRAQAASLVALAAGDPNSLEGRRNIALQELRTGAQQRAPIIEELVARIRAEEAPDIALQSRPTLNDILYHSLDRHIPQLALALGIDSIGAFFVLVLLCKAPRRKKDVKS